MGATKEDVELAEMLLKAIDKVRRLESRVATIEKLVLPVKPVPPEHERTTPVDFNWIVKENDDGEGEGN